MQSWQSSHVCTFCNSNESTPSTNVDIIILVNEKYILCFPGMILHYLDPPSGAHDWGGLSWVPPKWFSDMILHGDKIQYPVTRWEMLTLPVYHVGYLNTLDAIKREPFYPEVKQKLADKYDVNPNSQIMNGIEDALAYVIVDTQGGDLEYASGIEANFGAPNPILTETLSKLQALVCENKSLQRSTYIPNKFGDNNIQITQPPVIEVPPVSLHDYMWNRPSRIEILERESTKILREKMIDDEYTKNHVKEWFEIYSYQIIGWLKWEVDKNNDKATAKIVIPEDEKTEDWIIKFFNSFQKYDPLEKNQQLLKLLKTELNIPGEIADNEITVSLFSLEKFSRENKVKVPGMDIHIADVKDIKKENSDRETSKQTMEEQVTSLIETNFILKFPSEKKEQIEQFRLFKLDIIQLAKKNNKVYIAFSESAREKDKIVIYLCRPPQVFSRIKIIQYG